MNVDSKIVDLSLEEYLTMIEAPITVIPSWLVDEDQFQGRVSFCNYAASEYSFCALMFILLSLRQVECAMIILQDC